MRETFGFLKHRNRTTTDASGEDYKALAALAGFGGRLLGL